MVKTISEYSLQNCNLFDISKCSVTRKFGNVCRMLLFPQITLVARYIVRSVDRRDETSVANKKP